MVDLRVKIGRLLVQNPVMTASGTFGTGEEMKELVDLNKLGAVVVKGVTLLPRLGNKTPRITETPGGMLNAIGLQNPGIDKFISEKTAFFEKIKVPFIVNISGYEISEYGELAKRLEGVQAVSGIEVNVSCPNVKYSKGSVFAKDPKAVGLITKLVKKNTRKTVIIKLSPEVSDIKIIAKAAEDNGADALSLINTISGMAVDINTRKPKISNVMGGLSGPAIKPIGVRCVWQVYNAVKIPIIGMGGIMNAEDAIEYLLSGATAVAVGTANFINPAVTLEIVEGIRKYMLANKLQKIKDLTGGIIINQY